MTWLHFVFVQSVFVFVGQTLTMGAKPLLGALGSGSALAGLPPKSPSVTSLHELAPERSSERIGSPPPPSVAAARVSTGAGAAAGAAAAGGAVGAVGDEANAVRATQAVMVGAYHLLTVVHVFTLHLTCFCTTTEVTTLIAAAEASSQAKKP
jgi:hypothetical protein